MIKTDADLIFFENTLAKIGISSAGGRVAYIIDKKSGENIAIPGGNPFITARGKDGVAVKVSKLSQGGDVITALTDGGKFTFRVECHDRYFAFEMLAWDAPQIDELFFGCLSVDKKADELGVGVFGASMTVGVDPVDFPDFLNHRTCGRIMPQLREIRTAGSTGAVGAKYAAVVAPFEARKSILEEIYRDVDREKGIVSSTGGVWGRDSAVNFGNYTIQSESSMDFVRRNLPFFRSIGVDQIDFHKGPGTFRQGDFAFMRYETAADFRKNVTETLENNGLSAGLHTYSHYIDYNCDPLLSDKACREQLKVMETLTLGKSIDEAETYLPVEEDTAGVSVDFGFCVVNTPYLLIDDELVRFSAKNEHGLTVSARGCGGTKPASHKKGAAIKHLEGRYFGLTPVLGSELFYDIARRTAKTFNEGGFRMIYLDAIDGITSHCDPRKESSLYIASFVHEILKNCDRDPVLEASTYPPSMWAARGRTGAWDTPARSYKRYNALHANENKAFIDRFGVPILGWYDFYPLDDRYPGNEHVKYQHTDDIDHMGSLAVAYDFPNVFNGLTPEALEKYPALKRNVFLYKKYDDIRKSGNVPAEVRAKMRASAYEMRLVPEEKAVSGNGGRAYPAFQEAFYQKAKIYDIADDSRNAASFRNPFRRQHPFVRIEALLSAEADDVGTLIGIGKNAPLLFPANKRFDRELDISSCLAKHVIVRGNGVKGSKIAIKLRCATAGEKGFAEYIVDTGFTGEREFLLIESDNGERTDHFFEKGEDKYAIFRAPFNNDRVTEISVESEGDTEGVVLSSITSRVHRFVEIKEPKVTIGGTSAVFKCLLRSTDFIEFDGLRAFVLDRYGNRREIGFESDLVAPDGEFEAVLTSSDDPSGDGYVRRAQLTLGVYGETM